jgi:SAM-dependent methyltransferase
MYENKFIPLTEEAPLTLQGFYKIFHQDSEYFKFGLWHTNMQSLKESAILWLNFNKWLYKRGLGLIDGHCDNIIFVDAMRPVWCDIGSIVPVDGDSPFLGIEQFIRYYIYPLKLYEKNPLLGDISKKYLHSGMSHNIAASLGIMLPSLPNNREALLDFLKEEIESICLSPIKGQWSSYYGDDTLELDSSDTQSHRVSMFCRFIKILKPKSVVDIGANTGRFSRYCARKGAEVLAIEPDEQANFKHLAILRRKQFEGKIKLVQGDIRVDAGQPGELAIALALTHHLFFTCQYSWKYIANLLASRCTRYLLTEFMPWGLRIDAPPEDLPSHYNLQLFVEQLERYFHKVEVLSYTVPAGTSPRVFILCTEKREVPIDDGWDKFPLEERMSIMAVVDGKNVLHQAG